jgi:hypothetical protein
MSTTALWTFVVPTFRKRRERWGTLVRFGAVEITINVKGNGQECPFHGCEVGRGGILVGGDGEIYGDFGLGFYGFGAFEVGLEVPLADGVLGGGG